MPARPLGPKYRLLFTSIAVLFVVPTIAEAQTSGSSVTLQGRVSETVALSVAPNWPRGDVNVMSSGSTVRITLSGNGAGSRVIRVPLLVRSNSGFKISGNFKSTTAVLTQLSVTDVRATGRLVSPEVIDKVQISSDFDLSSLFVLLTGPRVSMGGSLNSPNNALQITVLIRVDPNSVGSWLAHLTFFND
jgi:hypothetical protein